jgi:hypothetical protein
MVNREVQKEIIAKVEKIFATYEPDRLDLILGELAALGFVRKGGNIAAISMEQTMMELFLIIGLDEKGAIASHEINRFDDLEIVLK